MYRWEWLNDHEVRCGQCGELVRCPESFARFKPVIVCPICDFAGINPKASRYRSIDEEDN